MVGGSVQSRHNTGRQAPPLSQGGGGKGEWGWVERDGGGGEGGVCTGPGEGGIVLLLYKGIKKMVGVFTGAHHFTAWSC